jgi:AraC-like DNA-binding protein
MDYLDQRAGIKETIATIVAIAMAIWFAQRHHFVSPGQRIKTDSSPLISWATPASTVPFSPCRPQTPAPLPPPSGGGPDPLVRFAPHSQLLLGSFRGIIRFVMHKTFAHISVATEADIGIPALFTRIEAHEEKWEASTTASQTYEATIEYQQGGLDRRWIAGREYRTTAGAFSVFAGGTCIEAEKIAPGELNCVEYLRLRGPMVGAVERALGIAPERPLILPKAPARLALTLGEATRTVFARQAHWQWTLIGVLAELTRLLVMTGLEAPLPEIRLVDRARALVEEAPHRAWSVKELADLLGVRRELLWAMFRRQTGQSPGEWIREHRIRVARETLKRGVSVRETAERLGFSSRQHFARSYRAVTGRAPSRHSS